MTKRKLKGYIYPAIYVLAIGTVILSVILIGRNMQEYLQQEASKEEVKEVIDPVLEENIPVIQEQPTEAKTIRPFADQTVKTLKEYYEKEAEETSQQNALIYYEQTYMQNSGILYGGDNTFDVVATMDGTIKNIKEDEILGTVVEIEHNNKLTTIYQSLKETNMTVGTPVKQGEVIGISGQNKIETTLENGLLFEVYHNGSLINPNNYYDKDLKEFTA